MFRTTYDTPATKATKRWQCFSPAMKAPAVARGIVNLVLVIGTLRDIDRRRDDELNGSRRLWTLAAFAPPIGPIAYFLLGRKRSASS